MMSGDDTFCLRQLALGQASVGGQRDVRLKPELGPAMRVRHMDVHSRLFARKEEETEGAIADDCGRRGSGG
jgi:hypothetical protein